VARRWGEKITFRTMRSRNLMVRGIHSTAEKSGTFWGGIWGRGGSPANRGRLTLYCSREASETESVSLGAINQAELPSHYVAIWEKSTVGGEKLRSLSPSTRKENARGGESGFA